VKKMSNNTTLMVCGIRVPNKQIVLIQMN